MFKELLALGQRLEQEGELPPSGFYSYKEPIKWVIHYPDASDQSTIKDVESNNEVGVAFIAAIQEDRSTIREAEINSLPRPYSGRTGNTQPYPLTDEAAYVLGINRGKGKGEKTAEKHAEFLKLLDKITSSVKNDNPHLSDIVKRIKEMIEGGRLKSLSKWKEIESKDWVSIQIESSNGDGRQLFEHPAVKEFWIKELSGLCLPGKTEKKQGKPIIGECGLSGKADSTLVGRIPLGVTLYKPIPFHSLNADAFVSGMEGTEVFERCHIGQSIKSGDLIARTLNYLRNKPLHHKILAKAIEKGKLNTDSPKNLFSFYWIEQPDEAKSAVSINPDDLLSKASLLLSDKGEDERETTETHKEKGKARLPVELSQLEALLKVPWTGQPHGLQLDENAFCLLMLSPNKGRISVREWFKVGLGRLKENLSNFLDAQRIEAPDGVTKRCFSIQDMLRAIEESNIAQPEYKAKELANSNITRALLHCAYLGEAPPTGLIEPAVICFRHPKVLRRYEQQGERERFSMLQHQLAAVMKLVLTHLKSEVNMNNDNQIDPNEKSAAFLCGSLLSILEEAQLASMNSKINTTLVDQFYSTAATAPCSVMGMLTARITSQHMPKLRKNMRWKYDKLKRLLEEIQTSLDCKDGFPKTLTLKQQAEFSLGFYTQRAAFSRERPSKKSTPETITTEQPITEKGETP